jgi:hypothetical protein
MTMHELMHWLEQFQGWISLEFGALPFLMYDLGALLRRWSCPWACGFLAAAVCVAVLPGICMTGLILYRFLFARVNLLREMHLVLHLLPVLSMVGTL